MLIEFVDVRRYTILDNFYPNYIFLDRKNLRCTEIRQQGPLAGEPEVYRLPCAVHVAMARAEKAWREALRQQMIADVIAQYHQNVEPQYLQESEQWIEGRMRRG